MTSKNSAFKVYEMRLVPPLDASSPRQIIYKKKGNVYRNTLPCSLTIIVVLVCWSPLLRRWSDLALVHCNDSARCLATRRMPPGTPSSCNGSRRCLGFVCIGDSRRPFRLLYRLKPLRVT
eukprot:scaffold1069_cov155-Amphora_coffeaeformis.AAC.7